MGLLDDAIKEHLELKRRRGADAGEISRLESEALGPVRRSAEGVPDLSDTFEPPREEPAGASDAEGATALVPPALAPLPPAPGLDDEDAAGRRPAPPPAREPAAEPSADASLPTPSSPATDPAHASAAPPYTSPPVIPPPTREAWMTEDLEPAPEPEPAAEAAPEPESAGLFSRLRGGRRAKQDRERPSAFAEPAPIAAEPEPTAHDPQPYEPPPPPRPSYEPPPLPVQHEPDIVPADDEPDVEDLLEETPEFLEETPEHDRLWFEQRPPRDFNFDD
jgi:hypothetical protein